MRKSNFKDATWELTKIVVPVLLGFGLAYITFHKEFDATEKARLNDNLNKLLDVNLQYPFVDDSVYIARWNKDKDSNSDSSLRYQTYCEYVFNFLQDVCEYYNYDRKRIAKFVDIQDLIVNQKGWWFEPAQRNAEAYPDEFKEFIDGCFK